MYSANKLTPEQMKRDADYLHKLRGYCYKVIQSINDLPNLRAYTELDLALWRAQEVERSAQMGKGIARREQRLPPVIDQCKRGLYDLCRYCSNLMGYIEQIGGPGMKGYNPRSIPKKELNRRDNNERVYGEINALRELNEDENYEIPDSVRLQIDELYKELKPYSHRAVRRPEKLIFTDATVGSIRVMLGDLKAKEEIHSKVADTGAKTKRIAELKHLFIKSAQESVNEYLLDSWDGSPNRKADIVHLEKLIRQVDVVLNKLVGFSELVASRRYSHGDNMFLEKDTRTCIGAAQALYRASGEAIESIKSAPRRHKPLEYALADALAYSYWATTGIKPSAYPGCGMFMEILSLIEDAMDASAPRKIDRKGEEVNRMGEDLVASVIAALPKPRL